MPARLGVTLSARRSSHPLAQTTTPPATWTIGTDRPKNSSTYVPTNSDASSRTNALIAIFLASVARTSGLTSAVIARNIGAPPNGLTIGSSAATSEQQAFDEVAEVGVHSGLDRSVDARRREAAALH